jgi:membrane protein required for colicin V production
MNWIDFFILFVLFVALLNGYRRGIFRELSTFLGLAVGVIFAVSNADSLVLLLEGKLNFSPSVLYVISFALVFLGCFLVFKFLGRYFYRMVKISPLKKSDKLGGGLVGVAKGLVVLSLLFLFFVFPTPFSTLDDALEDSAMAGSIRGLVPFIYDNTPYLHPGSDEFLTEVQKGILLSSASLYAQDPEGALKNKVVLGISDNDVETLDKLNKYLGKPQGELR